MRAAIADSGMLQLAFHFLDYILRAQTAVFEQIHTKKQLLRVIASMAILTMFLSSIYGFMMGLGNGPLQAFLSCIKLPLLFLLTAIICIPSLYTFNVLLGQRFRFVQTVALMVTTLGTTSVLLASLAPVAFFFTITTNNYSFLLLMHVGIMALCGVYGGSVPLSRLSLPFLSHGAKSEQLVAKSLDSTLQHRRHAVRLALASFRGQSLQPGTIVSIARRRKLLPCRLGSL